MAPATSHPVTQETFNYWATVITVLLAACSAAFGYMIRRGWKWINEKFELLEQLLTDSADHAKTLALHDMRLKSLEEDRERFHPRVVSAMRRRATDPPDEPESPVY